MDCVVKGIDELLEEIFAFSGFGMVHQSSILHFILLKVNFLIPLIVLIEYLLDGNLFISLDALSKFTDLVELFGPIIVHVINIFIFFANRKIFSELKLMWNKLNFSLRVYDEQFYLSAERKRILFFLLKVLFIQAVGIGIEAYQLISLSTTDPNWQSSIRTRVLSLNMNRLMEIQFIYYCDYTSSRINILNSLRAKILKINETSENQIKKNLKNLKTLDLDIIRFIQLSREYFKWMLLMNITLDVACITIDFYWIYGGLTFSDNPNFIQSVCCPWCKIFTLLVLFYSSNGIQEQRDNSLNAIFDWNTEYNTIANSKRRLLLQHLHTSKISLDANGFFYINYSALIGIIEAITVYMVYFFQFMSDVNIFTLAIELNEKNRQNTTLNQTIF